MPRFVLAALALSALVSTAQAQTPSAPHFVPVPDNAVLGTNLKGLNVYNSGEEKVGDITDVVIASGRLDGYILSVGGFLGLGTHYVVVNPAGIAVSYDAGKKAWHARIDATKDQLKAAPEFKYDGRWVFGCTYSRWPKMKQLDGLMKGLRFTQKKADSQVRWSVLNTILLLRCHESA